MRAMPASLVGFDRCLYLNPNLGTMLTDLDIFIQRHETMEAF